MDRIDLGTTGRTTTRLGYGCSSLMGAMGRKQSVALLEAAFDAGIRHFDVAPMYGFGQAESCVGEFLARHCADVTVTTKYGIPPAKNQGLIGVARMLARPVVKALPGLKRGLSNVAGKATQPAEKASFTAAQAKQSLERSLAELRTDRIDVWLLHEVTAEDLRDDGLLRLLEDSVAAGTIGTFGVGSGREKLSALLAARPDYCRTVQFEWSVLDPPVVAAKSFRIHHRALTDHFRELHAGFVQNKIRSARWSEKVGADLCDREVLASLMLKAALVENPQSVILFSSKSVAHMWVNVAAAEDALLEAPAHRLYALVQEEIATQDQPRVRAAG
ncbi:MAG TPA: aldo/keto reductase [Acidobacteriaceae bacterium]